MIAGLDFFGFDNGCVWDTPIATECLDELTLGRGMYDEMLIHLDTTITSDIKKPTRWDMKTILNPKFKGNLDGGSIGADGFKVTSIQLLRTVYGSGDWDVVGLFDYDEEYNTYTYNDRYVQNGATYQYAISPVANETAGEKLISDTVDCEYEGIFITDKNENRKLEFDIELGDVTYNNNSVVNIPLNSQYPVVSFGNSAFRTGTMTTLPLSRETIRRAGSSIAKLDEQVIRQRWVDFISNGKAKVLRMDSGVLILVVTSNPTVSHKQGEILRDLATISFDYTEIGKLNFASMMKNGLLADAFATKTMFDDYGNIVHVQ